MIALDAALADSRAQPILDLPPAARCKPELLVGEDGAKAIAKARADAPREAALEAGGAASAR